ncbi:ribbon-helix-helix domain-containing protein [Magnetovibrio blakemorei]|nr:ribbon-helix-helix domain-containing protein [Magnetovibrio blakemorei]
MWMGKACCFPNIETINNEARAGMNSRLQSRNVSVNGHRTSLRLERDVWEALEEICEREKMTVHETCTHVDQHRKGSSRTAAVRTFILGYFRAAASDAGHARVGHGRLAKRERSPKSQGVVRTGSLLD